MKQVTLQQKINELKEKNSLELEKKIRELTMKENLLEVTGLDFMVLIHSEKSTSVWIENNQYNKYSKFDRFKLDEYYKALCTVFDPEDSVIKVSGGEYKTFAPAYISFENHFSDTTYSHQQEVKIVFTFKDGVNVSFKLPSNPHFRTFSRDIIREDVAALHPHNKTRDGRKEKIVYSLELFGRVRMYGNNSYIYCENEFDLDEFMSVIFYGHTPEFKDRFVSGNIS